MTLSHHVNSEQLEKEYLKGSRKSKLNNREEYIFKYSSQDTVPKYEIPEESSDSHQVYKYLQEGLSLDGTPTLNLASFVNTDIDEVALKLVTENLVKNLADNDEYPSLLEYQQRCISIISDLWHAPKIVDKETGETKVNTVGAATTGSSEAIMLGGLALKKSWQERRKAAGKSTSNPNIIMATCAQVALEKFARYFDVEDRLISITEESGHLIDVSKIKDSIDENTIGIFVILGSTFTGSFEPVEEIAKLLDQVQKETGHDVKIHVDGASGGFVAPFVFPHLKWDFAIDRVVSINTSGHKFGLTTAGLGWVIWKDIKYLPETLRFKLDYLGGVEETFGLNFSRAGFPVIHQYYNLLTYGREGYAKLFDQCIQNARLFSNVLEGSKYFDVLSVIHKKATPEERKKLYTREVSGDLPDYQTANEEYQPGLPVVAFRFSKYIRDNYPELPQSIFSLLLRNKGFIVPNYHLPPDEYEKEILRVVVRPSLSLNLLDKLIEDTISSLELLIESCDSVHQVVTDKHTTEAEDHASIYNLLLTIASGGVEDLKKAQHEALDKPETGHNKNKKSYRGAC
ncbi:glutamate decarboxylase [[Candida] railenensis]|uniref:Glutamate decarboxylase n=1 Tax=[Candida] railenensis TaxID=45579 RepID=A0A9P0QSF4_9ASCO|nr:glutamate decarboxylase [[Candida] railenensis]